MSAQYKKLFEAVFRMQHPISTKWTIKKCAKYLNMSCTFVKRWSDHCRETGHVDEKPGRGMNHVTSKREHKAIVLLFEKKPIYLMLGDCKKTTIPNIGFCTQW